MRHLLLFLLAAAQAQDPSAGWWMAEPIRWFQTNTGKRQKGLVALRAIASFMRLGT